LLRSIYDRELQSVLFSVNQHCWDVYNSWLSELVARVSAAEDLRGQLTAASLVGYFRGKDAVTAVAIADSSAAEFVSLSRDHRTPVPIQALREGLRGQWEEVEKSFRQSEKGYSRPVALPAADSSNQLTWLVAPVRLTGAPPYLVALLLDQWHFANDVVGRKLNSIATNEFLFSVRNRRTGRILFETEEVEETRFERAEPLWILPDVEVRVKLRGTTLEDVARASTRRNLLYLAAVDFLLLLASAFLVRNVLQETRLAQMKTDFVANVSHELRTPLSLIRMYAEMLEMGRVRSEEKKKHYFRTIMNESARLTQLINNILDFARLEAGRKQYRFQPLSLNEVVLETMEMFRYHLEQQGFRVEIDLDECLPPIVGDRAAVMQALVNLLDNARKFSPRERWIGLRTGSRDGEAFISVSDRGIGIPPSEQDRIFEKFYRVGSSLPHDTKGSGLGLTIVKHIVEDHRGRVEVQSTPGKGSTFVLFFPIATAGDADGQDPRGRR